jgi:class 3 adenylate cyclase
MSDDPKKPEVPNVRIFSSSEPIEIDWDQDWAQSIAAKSVAFPNTTSSLFSFYPDHEQVRALEDQIRVLRDDLAKKTGALQQEEITTAKHKLMLQERNATLEELKRTQQFRFLLGQVAPEAAHALLGSESLRAKFLGAGAKCQLFAMSVDIRRSTDLMLKARTPQAFASFITGLCKDLMDVVYRNHGVVDKFTGDGILSFFPEFFSGKDAGYYALAAADACHSTFDKHYRAHRNSFQSVLCDVGLGIGIDYGECHLVQVAGSLTIVGSPVVYACRLGGAPAGKTLLNQPAYEVISEKHGSCVLLNETSIEIKHEGPTLAYSAALSRSVYRPVPPAWRDSNGAAADTTTEKPSQSLPTDGPPNVIK